MGEDDRGKTPLHVHQHHETVQLLLNREADPNPRGPGSRSCLARAIRSYNRCFGDDASRGEVPDYGQG